MEPITILVLTVLNSVAFAQNWTPDLGNDRYKNPIIFADYSDPDVIRVGSDYYMVASSFTCMPGIPILHSTDLVNWEIINHVYQSLPLERYNKPIHGQGSWAPAIRFHNNRYYVYFCTPHDGLFMAETDHPAHEWQLHQIVQVELWEDPCPFWDDNGDAYLVRSKVCGDELFLHRMSPDGKKLLDNGISIFKSATQPTIEGPKMMKKEDYYYIHAPAGGVPTGWQTALRSKNIFGPYEEKKVLHTGNTKINGPHQGGVVEAEDGSWWFLHFQSRGHLGRIVHLQPVFWRDGWPEMGIDGNNDGFGEPVLEYNKPTSSSPVIKTPQTSDEFNSEKLGLQWQWQANPQSEWYSFSKNPGSIRLYATENLTQNGNFWFVPNLLLQKFPQPIFSATTQLAFHPKSVGEKAGIVVIGKKWAYLSLEKMDQGFEIAVYEGNYQQCNDLTVKTAHEPTHSNAIYFRVETDEKGLCSFSFSHDNRDFRPIGKLFKAEAGVWIGAKTGIFCISPNPGGEKGWADFDWFRVE
jgi:beta-xylosidase